MKKDEGSNLRNLDVSNNQLESMPDSLVHMPSLGVVYIHNNNFVIIPIRLYDLTNNRTTIKRVWWQSNTSTVSEPGYGQVLDYVCMNLKPDGTLVTITSATNYL